MADLNFKILFKTYNNWFLRGFFKLHNSGFFFMVDHDDSSIGRKFKMPV